MIKINPRRQLRKVPGHVVRHFFCKLHVVDILDQGICGCRKPHIHVHSEAWNFWRRNLYTCVCRDGRGDGLLGYDRSPGGWLGWLRCGGAVGQGLSLELGLDLGQSLSEIGHLAQVIRICWADHLSFLVRFRDIRLHQYPRNCALESELRQQGEQPGDLCGMASQ